MSQTLFSESAAEADRRFGRKAAWRGLSHDADVSLFSLGFDHPDGSVTRIRIPAADARRLATAVLDAQPNTGSQSSNESGIRISSGSLPQEGHAV